MTLLSILSASNTFLDRALFSASSSTTSSTSRRSSGPSPFSWSPSRSCPSCLCFNALERRRLLQHITWQHWGYTERFTSLIGYIGVSADRPSGSDTQLLMIFNRYFTEGVVDPIAVTAGILQTGLYLDFFYVYFTKYVSYPFLSFLSDTCLSFRVLQGEKFELPA